MSDEQQHGGGGSPGAGDDDPEESASRLDALIQERRDKLAQWRARGVEPYPVGVGVSDTLAAVRERWDAVLSPGEETDATVAIAGRVVLRRGHGKLVFLVLREWDTDLQVLAQLDVLGED